MADLGRESKRHHESNMPQPTGSYSVRIYLIVKHHTKLAEEGKNAVSSTVHNPETYYAIQRGWVLSPTLERQRGVKAGTSPRTPPLCACFLYLCRELCIPTSVLHEYLLVEAVSFVPGCPDMK